MTQKVANEIMLLKLSTSIIKLIHRNSNIMSKEITSKYTFRMNF